jgi:hypothetical protein
MMVEHIFAADRNNVNVISLPDTSTPELQTHVAVTEHLEEQPKSDQPHENTARPLDSGEQPQVEHYHEHTTDDDAGITSDFTQSESGQLSKDQQATLEQQHDENTATVHESENSTEFQEIVQDEGHEEVNVDDVIQEGTNADSEDSEVHDRSVEAPCEMSNESTERMNEIETRTEDLVIGGEHKIGGKDLQTVSQSEAIKIEEGATLSPQEKQADFYQPQATSTAEQSQSDTQSVVQERRLYGHIHNIFGKQQGEKINELYLSWNDWQTSFIYVGSILV